MAGKKSLGLNLIILLLTAVVLNKCLLWIGIPVFGPIAFPLNTSFTTFAICGVDDSEALPVILVRALPHPPFFTGGVGVSLDVLPGAGLLSALRLLAAVGAALLLPASLLASSSCD